MKYTSYTQHPTTLPPQYLKSTSKTPKWGRDCVLAIKAMGSSYSDMNRSSVENKQENYDLVNSIFRKENMEHVLNPYNIDASKYGGTATKMQNYNILRSRLETLKGEEMNSPLNYFVYAISGEAVSSKKKKKKEHLRELMRNSIIQTYELQNQIQAIETKIQELQKAAENLTDRQKLQQLTQQLQQLQEQRQNMPDIQEDMKKFNSSYVDPTEQTNNKILQFLERNDQLGMKFNQGWFHALVSAEEVYSTEIKQGHPSARAVNPLQFAYDKGANTTFIHEGNWAREEFWLPGSEIIDMVGDALTDSQVKRILSGQAGHTFTDGNMMKNFVYSSTDGQRRKSHSDQISDHVYVMKCAWRSAIKVGELTYQDPRTGKEQKVEVDDTFKMTPELTELGAYVKWGWETEIWEGTLIGDDIFVNVRPKLNQTKNLPYVGYIYNNVNSVATSMIDLSKAHQYTYIVTWWRLEQEIAKAKGKKFIMDFAQLPKSMGWDVEQWVYYFENMGVIWINSKEEGRKGDPTSTATFNQFQSIDMSLSQVVSQYIAILDKLEGLVEEIMGVSPQRMGAVKPSETATGAQTAIARSTNVTKPWFYFHDLTKEAVLTELLELAKVAYMDGTELELVISEFETETLKVDGDLINSSDMGVFLTNSYEDRVNKEKVMQLLEAAVQQGKASLLDVANALDSKSLSYVKAKLEEGEKRAQENAERRDKMMNETEQKKIAKEERKEELDRTKDVMIAREKNQTDLAIKHLEVGVAEGKNEMEITKMVKSSLEFAEDLELKQAKAAEDIRLKEKAIDEKPKLTTNGN